VVQVVALQENQAVLVAAINGNKEVPQAAVAEVESKFDQASMHLFSVS
jgi:hypothetical protein